MKANILTIEACGVRGLKSFRWCKKFKSIKALNAWIEKTDAEVYAICDIQPDDVNFR